MTKGDQYDVREAQGNKEVRNLGKPVELAQRYYEDGADEVRERAWCTGPSWYLGILVACAGPNAPASCTSPVHQPRRHLVQSATCNLQPFAVRGVEPWQPRAPHRG